MYTQGKTSVNVLGIEPKTIKLKAYCSTIELYIQNFLNWFLPFQYNFMNKKFIYFVKRQNRTLLVLKKQNVIETCIP